MSEYTSSNKTGSFSTINHKTRLIGSGSAIRAATKRGAGQEGYCDSTGVGIIKGTDLITDPTNNLWEKKIERLTWQTKVGYYTPVAAASAFTGLYVASTQVGTAALAALDTTNGLTATYTSGASAGNQAGVNRALLYTVRAFNPSFKLQWKTDEAAANIRFFAGFTSATAVIGNSDDPLNTLSGFGIAMDTTQANYRIFHNDGVGATATEDTGIAKDTNYHTIEIWMDDSDVKIYWSLDGSAPVAVITEIPASTTSLSCQFLVTAVNADAKVMNVLKSVITSDK